MKQDFRSKYLPDLSESTSENENMARNRKFEHPVHNSTPNSKNKHRRQYHSMEYLENEKNREPARSDISSHRTHTLGRGREQKHR